MAKKKAKSAEHLDWENFPSALPKESVVYPEGERKASLVARVRRAVRKVEVKQPA